MPGCSPGREGVGKATFRPRRGAARAGRGRRAAGRPARARNARGSSDRPAGRGRQPSRHALLERLENPKTGDAGPQHQRRPGPRRWASCSTSTPCLSPWRAVVIDSADDLEASGRQCLAQDARGAAGQLPVPARQPCAGAACCRPSARAAEGSIFSRLDDDAMTSVLEAQLPDCSDAERARIIAMAGGSAGRALAFAELDLAKLEDAALRDPARRRPDQRAPVRACDRARPQGRGRALRRLPRLVPSLIAREARRLDGPARERALDAYAKSRELAALAPRLSLDPGRDRVPARRNPRSVACPLP